jgi:membrane protein implicated in regulation of membrane protease activity
MAWWLWVVGGLALLAIEMLTPGGFFFVFFGISAVVIGVLASFGLVEAAWLQWLLFSVISVASLLVFRRPLMRALKLDVAAKPVDSIAGEEAVVVEEVTPGGTGKAELRGTVWAARTQEPVALVKGQRCRVERVDGLTLWLRGQG